MANREEYYKLLAQQYIDDIYLEDVVIHQVGKSGFHLRDTKNERTAFVTWDHATSHNKPDWKAAPKVQRGTGAAVPSGKRQAPAKKKPGRRARRKAKGKRK